MKVQVEFDLANARHLLAFNHVKNVMVAHESPPGPEIMSTVEAVEPVAEPPAEEEPKPKPKRKRRTKAEIEADKKAQAEAEAETTTELMTDPTPEGGPEVTAAELQTAYMKAHEVNQEKAVLTLGKMRFEYGDSIANWDADCKAVAMRHFTKLADAPEGIL